MNLLNRNTTTIAGVLALGASLAVWSFLLLFPSLFASWEWSTYDLRLRFSGAAPAAPSLVIIGRDAESDARFGVGIWDRAIFARVIDALDKADAAVIAPDFHFASASPSERGGPTSDTALIEATKVAGNVVYPVPVSLRRGDLSPQAGSLPSAPRDSVLRHSTAIDGDASQRFPSGTLGETPLRQLLEHARGLGHMAAQPDEDGVYRRVPAYVNIGGQALPAFGVAIATAFLHMTPDLIALRSSWAVEFRGARFPDGTIKDLILPLDSRGNLLINYAGRWTDGAFPYFSFVDIWDAIEDGDREALKAQVSGKIVLLLHAAIEADKRRTPFELKAPGGFIHANVINTILTRRTMTGIGMAGQMALTVILALVASSLILTIQGWRGLVAASALAAGYVGVTHAVIVWNGLVLPMLTPLFALVVSSGATLAWTNWQARRRIHGLEADALAAQSELARTQEVLTSQESVVERLEKDMGAAQAELAASSTMKDELSRHVDQLKAQLMTTQAHLDATRRYVQRLQAKLADFTTASVGSGALSNAELERLRQECEQLGIMTQSPAVLTVFQDLKKVAPSHLPILLLGETGTGKELFAHVAHQLSRRAKDHCVDVNVSAVPAELAESEWFGHEKGAFTVAIRDHKGFFERAHGGTIFLDEIIDLRLDLQAKLLRVLQDGTFYRVGATTPTCVEVRVIAATNKDLRQGVVQGWFREDLYYRLRGIELRLPPLRERPGDIPLLAGRLLREVARQADRDGMVFSQAALETLQRWPWPGNIRDLKTCIERALSLCQGSLITEQDLRLDPSDGTCDEKPIVAEVSDTADARPADEGADDHLLACLRETCFDIQATAQILDCNRTTVTQRFKGLCFRAMVEHREFKIAAQVLAGGPSLSKIAESKLADYYEHLIGVLKDYSTEDQAIAGCRKRFKNFPERHREAMETLIRRYFENQRGSSAARTV